MIKVAVLSTIESSLQSQNLELSESSKTVRPSALHPDSSKPPSPIARPSSKVMQVNELLQINQSQGLKKRIAKNSIQKSSLQPPMKEILTMKKSKAMHQKTAPQRSSKRKAIK